MQKIAYRLKLFRESTGLRQQDFAGIAGIGLRTYAGWEKAETSFPFHKLDQLVRHYHLNLNWLLTGEGAMLCGAGSPTVKEKENEIAALYEKLDEVQADLNIIMESVRRMSRK